MIVVLFKRALKALLLLMILNGCATNSQWALQESGSEDPHFRSGRLVLAPESNLVPLSLEILRTCSGLRIYINSLLLPVPPFQGNPDLAQLEIEQQDGQVLLVYPYRLAGGQRLLFPADVSQHLIQLLMDNQPFTIKVRSKQICVIPANFLSLYFELMKIPIG
jgi:hypothetical protein